MPKATTSSKLSAELYRSELKAGCPNLGPATLRKLSYIFLLFQISEVVKKYLLHNKWPIYTKLLPNFNNGKCYIFDAMTNIKEERNKRKEGEKKEEKKRGGFFVFINELYERIKAR